MEKWREELFKDVFDIIKNNGNSTICSTCKHFDGKVCAKKKISAGHAIKLSDCNDEWEVCGG